MSITNRALHEVVVTFPHFLYGTNNAYHFILVIVSACAFFLFLIVNSPFGNTLRAIREDPERAEFIGIKIKAFQLIGFIVAAVFVGIVGALFTFIMEASSLI